MGIKEDLAAGFAAINAATNEMSGRLASNSATLDAIGQKIVDLASQIGAGGLSSQEEAEVASQLTAAAATLSGVQTAVDAESDRLTEIAADPTTPVP